MNIKRKITKVNFSNRNTNPKYIAIHYVGAVSTAANNATYFYSTYRGASAHYFVDENEIWQVVEDTDTSWGVGGTVYQNTPHPYYKICTNSNCINIEMCVKKKDGKWFYEPKTLDNTAELVQCLMKKYNIPAKNVITHRHVTGKQCPANYTTDATWKPLHEKLTGTSTETSSVPEQTTVKGVESYKGYITIKYDGLSYRSKPSWDKSAVAGTVKKNVVLTVKGRIKVDGVYMYQVASGWFITSASEYVTYSANNPTSKPASGTASTSKVEYLNLYASVTERTIYNSKLAKVGTIKPKKYGGLSYKILGYCNSNRYVRIKTGTYGEVRICIDKKVTGDGFSISGTRKYKNGD